MQSTRNTFLSLVVFSLFLPVTHAQESKAPPNSPDGTTGVYPDSAEGLRLLLENAVSAARDRDQTRLKMLVQQMEIPEYDDWYTGVYGQEKGEPRAQLYARALSKNEDDIEETFTEFSRVGGGISTRSVNQSPNSGNGFESTMLQMIRQPVDIYFAAWKKNGPQPDAAAIAVGYFVFLDGKFRWDSTIRFMKFQPLATSENVVPQADAPPQNERGNLEAPPRPGSRGVGYPTCEYCPDPEYPKKDKAKHIEGTVVLQVVVQPDGFATDIKVIKTPDQDLADNAIEAVERWRFKPARDRDGQAVAVVCPIEVTFRLLK